LGTVALPVRSDYTSTSLLFRSVEKYVQAAGVGTMDETRSHLREVRFGYSQEFPRVLEQLNAALLISTYQAGRLVVVGLHEGKLTFSFHTFERAMGVAAEPQRIAVGARRQVFILRPEHNLAAQVEPRGQYDACWLARTSMVTGNVHGHELAWGADGLWLVNSLFSCLCTLDGVHSFVPRWRPPFITELAGQDRCHLSGLAMQDGRPRFVTAHAESNEPAGWRPIKAASGCVIDVPTGQTIVRGLCMPHSPRWHEGRLWALDSGTGRLIQIDPQTAQVQTVARFPGYTRGLALCGQFAFVGLSKIRETSMFGGIPIAEQRDGLRCGVAAVDLVSGQTVAWLQFDSGVTEVFAVSTLPGCRNPFFSGPLAEEDDRQDIWVIPPEGTAPAAPPSGAAAS
jgi:protein O-GlcNAc transferase